MDLRPHPDDRLELLRRGPSITFGDMAEQPRDVDATGIVIDPHRWSDPQADEWEWPDEEDSA